MNFLFVALGGALGAVCRYGLSLLIVKSDFPVMTFVTNLFGAFIIGVIVGISEKNEGVSKNFIIFLKTGFCGGFTTFSTFSLETWKLMECQKYAMAGIYAGISVICCIFGVALGKWIVTLK